MTKLLVSDLDGTLIGQSKEISPAVRQAIDDWRRAGNRFVIATGRMVSSAEYFADQLGVADYLICCSGAVLYHNKKIVHHSTVPAHYVSTLWRIMQRNDGYVQIYSHRALIANKRSDLALSYERYSSGLPAAYHIPIHYLSEWRESFDQPIHKLSFTFKSDAEAQAVLRSLGDMRGVNYFKSLSHLYDIIAKDANKGLAIKRLLPHLGISAEDTYVVGDNENDIAMFDHFANSAIMASAPQHLHKKAKWTLPSAEQDGLAVYIKHLLA